MASKKKSIKILQVAFIAVYSLLYFLLYTFLNISGEVNWAQIIMGFVAITYPLGLLFCFKTKTNPMLTAVAVLPTVVYLIGKSIMVAVGVIPLNGLMRYECLSYNALVVAVICATRAVLLGVDYLIIKKNKKN